MKEITDQALASGQLPSGRDEDQRYWVRVSSTGGGCGSDGRSGGLFSVSLQSVCVILSFVSWRCDNAVGVLRCMHACALDRYQCNADAWTRTSSCTIPTARSASSCPPASRRPSLSAGIWSLRGAGSAAAVPSTNSRTNSDQQLVSVETVCIRIKRRDVMLAPDHQ